MAETNRRLLNWYIERWRANDKEVRKLLRENELWFVLVANPTATSTRSTRSVSGVNLRNNDYDPATTIADGVDPNRNYPNHFMYDEVGSSSIFSSQTYRGPSAVSRRRRRR